MKPSPFALQVALFLIIAILSGFLLGTWIEADSRGAAEHSMFVAALILNAVGFIIGSDLTQKYKQRNGRTDVHRK